MKVDYSQRIRVDVIQDVLANAGRWGQRMIDRVAWAELCYEVIDYPGAALGSDFTTHAVPNPSGPGTCRTPSRLDALVDRIVDANLSFACADFAMPDGNPRIGASHRIAMDGVMFYVAQRRSGDFRRELNTAISAATSWTFFGMLFDQDVVGPGDLAADAAWVSIQGFVFGVYAGDSYLIGNRRSSTVPVI